MRYTIGNNNPGPSSPSTMSQLFANTPQNVGKFTAHGAVADTSTGPLKMDITFAHSYVVRQTQKGHCAHGFIDASGNKIGVWGKDQDGAASLTKAQFDAANGHAEWRADYNSAGDFTFQGGAG